MAIPERQLDTWSSQPSSGPSRDTYGAVREVLDDRASPFACKRRDIFLQDSYGNDTNVANDSDVDVVSLTTPRLSTTTPAPFHRTNTLHSAALTVERRATPINTIRPM
ncbi:hypothetical protein GGD56_004878 [Rhizobium mongolense]|uniref:Uncharacterized protein n=1 Tax=Rhizobium mongolense TaxID=57676 RepID=A0ABR6ISX0_9HYPH|nr:hypothetical protein [Rhizobium mongolense]